MKIHKTKNFIRIRIRDPKQFIRGTFRTHDIGRKGYSKRIAGILKRKNKWATQSLLISKKEPYSMIQKMLRIAKYQIKIAKKR